MLRKTVVDQAFQFYSAKHLDDHLSSNVSRFTTGFKYAPAKKYTLAAFSPSQLESITCLYRKLYPALITESVHITQTYRKMLSVTINDQVFHGGQYALANSSFTQSEASTGSTNTPESLLRPAKLWHFAIHSVVVDESTNNVITHGFAIVSWPMSHPQCHALGKPCEVWCLNLFDCDSALPEIIPIDCISSFLLTITTKVNDENVLLTVPLI